MPYFDFKLLLLDQKKNWKDFVLHCSSGFYETFDGSQNLWHCSIAQEDLGKMDVADLPRLSFCTLVLSLLCQTTGLVFLYHNRFDFLNFTYLCCMSHTNFPLFHSYQSVLGRHLSIPDCSAQQLVVWVSSGLLLKQSDTPELSAASLWLLNLVSCQCFCLWPGQSHKSLGWSWPLLPLQKQGLYFIALNSQKENSSSPYNPW